MAWVKDGWALMGLRLKIQRRRAWGVALARAARFAQGRGPVMLARVGIVAGVSLWTRWCMDPRFCEFIAMANAEPGSLAESVLLWGGALALGGVGSWSLTASVPGSYKGKSALASRLESALAKAEAKDAQDLPEMMARAEAASLAWSSRGPGKKSSKERRGGRL